MTLVIGIKCEDGVVVAADGKAILGSPTGGLPTVEQQISKLEISHGQVIFGTSGAVGLAQQVFDELDPRLPALLRKTKLNEVRTGIRDQLVKHIEPRLKMAILYQNIAGPHVAQQNAIILTMIALPFNNQPILLQFDQQGNCEAATMSIPFVAIGSGQDQADPFLAFLKRILWNDKYPSTVGEGVFAALWTLDHVSRVNAARGVGGEPQIAVLKKDQSNEWSAAFLNDDQKQEHYQAISGAEKALRDYTRSFNP